MLLRNLMLIALLACSKKTDGVPVSGHVQIVANSDGFQPASITVQKDHPLTLDFKRTSDDTCATEVVFPELKIEKKLPLGQVVPIEIPTGETRTLSFQCGMAMYKSKVVIVPQ